MHHPISNKSIVIRTFNALALATVADGLEEGEDTKVTTTSLAPCRRPYDVEAMLRLAYWGGNQLDIKL